MNNNLELNCGTGAGGFKPGNTCAGGGSAREISKIVRDVVGNEPTTQPRAKAGGEIGPNGEPYPGGAFIATTELPKQMRRDLEKQASGRVAVEQGKYEVPAPGMMSINDKLVGTVMTGRGEVNQQYMDYIGASPEDRAMYQELADKWKAGERWVSVNDYPKLANVKDAARLLVANQPVPGALLDKLPEKYRERLTKFAAAKGLKMSGHDFSTGAHTTVLILNAHTEGFLDAVTLGQGLPKEKDGFPVRYRWKESLPLGRYLDKNGKPFEVTPQRVQNLILNFNRAKSKGLLPRVPDGHTTDATKNLGYIVDARKNAKGSLELLHQLIGEDAYLASARNRTSICTLGDVCDAFGEHYDEIIGHNAIVPDEQLTNLDDFQPVLAASRAAAAETVVLQLAADEQESEMDITKLREAVGAAKEVSDADVIAQAVAKLGEGTKALELSRSNGETITALTKRATDAEKDRDEAKAKVLELSKSQPDASLLEGNLNVAEGRLQLVIDRGQCTDDQAKLIREHFLKPDGKPGLMLSRSPYAGPVDAVFKLLELNKAFTGFQQTTSQPVARNVPGASGQPDLMTEGKNAGVSYQNAQLATRGLK